MSFHIFRHWIADVKKKNINPTMTSVEFALHPQHEASCDSEIQTKKVLKRKFRKQLGRLSIISLNSKDKEEAFESQGRITIWIEF